MAHACDPPGVRRYSRAVRSQACSGVAVTIRRLVWLWGLACGCAGAGGSGAGGRGSGGSAASGPALAVAARSGDTAIVDATVVPMSSDGALAHHTVVIRGDRIVAVAPSAAVTI